MKLRVVAEFITPARALESIRSILMLEVWFDLRDGGQLCLPHITELNEHSITYAITWLWHAQLNPRDFSRVTTDEVIHRMRRRERAHGGEHAEGVAGQENHVGRVSRRAGDFGILNELYRISAAGIFRDARIGEVHVLVVVQDHVFQYGAKTQRLEDIRFAFGR